MGKGKRALSRESLVVNARIRSCAAVRVRALGCPRGASDEHSRKGSVRSEQRSPSEKELLPFRLRPECPLASLFLSRSPTKAMLLRHASSPGILGTTLCNEFLTPDTSVALPHEVFDPMGSRPHTNHPTICYLNVMNTLLLIVVLLLLFGGGGFYFGGPVIGGSGLGLILLICLVIYFMGGFRGSRR